MENDQEKLLSVSETEEMASPDATELEILQLKNDLKIIDKQRKMDLELNQHRFDLEIKYREMMLERELSRNNISIIFAKFFVWFISICVSFMFIGAIVSGFGVDFKLEIVSDNILEIIKIAVLPVAMLVLGFHFGGGNSSNNLSAKLSEFLPDIIKKSNNKNQGDG